MRPVTTCLCCLILPILVAACGASPSPRYRGIEPAVIRMGDREFRVWVQRTGAIGHVQIVRMGYVPRSGHGGLRPAMLAAAEQASGCRIAPGSATGDTGVMNARLRCRD